MRHCQFQDEPGRRGLCLRTLNDVVSWEGMRDLRTCDDDRAAHCPHRTWTVEGRDRLLSIRIEWLRSCPSCGSNHDSLREGLNCQADAIVGPIIEMRPGPIAQGSREKLLPDRFPALFRARAWRKVRSMVLNRDGQRCQECGRDLTRYPRWYAEVHHIIPVIAGGSDHPDNLITLCTECHGGHTDKMVFPVSTKMKDGNSGRSVGRSLRQSLLDRHNI